MSQDQRPGHRPAQPQRSSEDKRRDRFAREMTRSVFGRYYWDRQRESELKTALRRKPKQPK